MHVERLLIVVGLTVVSLGASVPGVRLLPAGHVEATSATLHEAPLPGLA